MPPTKRVPPAATGTCGARNVHVERSFKSIFPIMVVRFGPKTIGLIFDSTSADLKPVEISVGMEGFPIDVP